MGRAARPLHRHRNAAMSCLLSKSCEMDESQEGAAVGGISSPRPPKQPPVSRRADYPFRTHAVTEPCRTRLDVPALAARSGSRQRGWMPPIRGVTVAVVPTQTGIGRSSGFQSAHGSSRGGWTRSSPRPSALRTSITGWHAVLIFFPRTRIPLFQGRFRTSAPVPVWAVPSIEGSNPSLSARSA